jgi:hypothetical protein
MTLASARGSRRWTGISPTVTFAVTIALFVGGCSSSSHSSAPTTPGSTTPGSSAPGRDHGRVFVVPKLIDPTGRADVTKALQRFLAKVPDGSVIKFRPGGRYKVNGTISVNHRHGLTFDGAGALVFAPRRGSRDRSQFWIRDGSAITFRNLKIRGANEKGGTADAAYVAKLAKQHGLRFEGVNGAEVDHVTVTNVYGDFVYVGLDSHEVHSRNVWIHDSTFRNNGRQGVAVTAASGVIIERNTFRNTRRSTIDLEPTGHRWHVDHVFVLDNTVGNGRLLFVASHGLGPVDDVVISGNRLQGHDLNIDELPPKKRRRSNWIITDNTSDSTMTGRALRIAQIDGLMIRGNKQKVSGDQPALALSGVCGAQVSDNDFGGGPVRSAGDVCTAALAVPQPPVIAGRTPGSGGSTLTGARHGRTAWIWIIAALVVLSLAVVLMFVLRRRRQRRRRREAPVAGDVEV